MASCRGAGRNDGIVSTASLVVGVAAADSAGQHVLIAGIAGLVAGALVHGGRRRTRRSARRPTPSRQTWCESATNWPRSRQAEEDELAGDLRAAGRDLHLRAVDAAG